MHAELRRKGVTLSLLWEEYRGVHPDGYGYSRYCELYTRWEGKLSPVMRQRHPAGERLFVDCAGQTADVVAPGAPIMALTTLILCLAAGWWMISGRQDANLARSALTGAVILLGNAMAPLSDTVEVSSLERLLEIAAAVTLATITFIVLDKALPDRRTMQPELERHYRTRPARGKHSDMKISRRGL